jgi:hypothetical protein
MTNDGHRNLQTKKIVLDFNVNKMTFYLQLLVWQTFTF